MALQEVQEHETATGTVQMLQGASLMFESPCLHGNDLVFQQYTMPVGLLPKKKNITVLDHPGFSLDLKPIENFSMDGKGSLQKWTKLPDSKCSWAVFTTCRYVPIYHMEMVASMMPKQIFEVINNNFGATHYRVSVLNFNFCFGADFQVFLEVWS